MRPDTHSSLHYGICSDNFSVFSAHPSLLLDSCFGFPELDICYTAETSLAFVRTISWSSKPNWRVNIYQAFPSVQVEKVDAEGIDLCVILAIVFHHRIYSPPFLPRLL